MKDDMMSDSSNDPNNPGAAGGAEPSMEEIQASIRRILREEDENQRLLEDDQEDDVLQLDASMRAVQPAPAKAAEASAPAQTVLPPEPAPEMNMYQPPSGGQDSAYNPEPEEEGPMENENSVQIPKGLVGDEASNSIANSIGTLVHSISTERAVAVSRGGITIEDLVREEIKPVLKAWLDTQLPSLVERVVRAEIKRVIDRT